jgi:hypothetical protein
MVPMHTENRQDAIMTCLHHCLGECYSPYPILVSRFDKAWFTSDILAVFYGEFCGITCYGTVASSENGWRERRADDQPIYSFALEERNDGKTVLATL